jgi:MtN3 and saliva related transmembrane protein
LSFGEILGLVAGAITTGSLIPQVLRVYRLKAAREISLTFTVAFLVGDAAWLAYGVIFSLVPIIFWNVLAILLAGTLLIGKIKYGKISDANKAISTIKMEIDKMELKKR